MIGIVYVIDFVAEFASVCDIIVCLLVAYVRIAATIAK
jgi:hypothetical protein